MALLDDYIGKRVIVFAINYFWWGVVNKADDEFIELGDCWIVYNTGLHEKPQWSLAEKLVDKALISRLAIEMITTRFKIVDEKNPAKKRR